jgi:hypothetical protein
MMVLKIRHIITLKSIFEKTVIHESGSDRTPHLGLQGRGMKGVQESS